MKMKKITAMLMAMLMGMMLFAACGNTQEEETISTAAETGSKSTETGEATEPEFKEMTISFNFATNTLDPAADRRLFAVRTGVAETLVKISQELTLDPWLAESWETEDSITWTFHIKDGITFSNGTACDAAAVQASIQRLIDNSKGLNRTLDIASMSADGLDLTIVCNDVHPSLVSDFGHPQTCIVDVNAEDMATCPIGTGPYTVSAFTEYAEVTLTKNDNYWDGTPNIDVIHFQTNEDGNARLMALQSGDADIIFKPDSSTLESIDATEGLKVDSVDGIRDHMIMYNMNSPYASDVNFRKGIDSLIDRETIISQMLYGQADIAVGCFAEGFAFTPEYQDVRTYDVDAALEYFAAAGLTVEDGMVTDNGSPIVLTYMTYSSQADFPGITQLIQASLMQVGIQANIENSTQDIDSWLAANQTGWDMSMYSIFAVPRGDASYFLNMAYTDGGILNYGSIQDEELFGYVEAFKVETVEATRNDYAASAASYAYDNCYNSYLVHPRVVVCLNEDRVSGWVTSKVENYIVTKDLDVIY